jgi:hypothetical protein
MHAQPKREEKRFEVRISAIASTSRFDGGS